jgi:hypothetical protein
MAAQDRFEEFAMHIKAIQQERKWVDVDTTAADFGLTSHEGRRFVDWLTDKGWATTEESLNESLKLRLTKPGIDEIGLLSLPPWRRWLHKNLVAVIGITIAILSLAVAVIALFRK